MSYYQQMKVKTAAINNKNEVYILGLESSCDETSAAVVKNGREVLSNIIASQIEIHKEYGGVVPEIASRKHVEAINAVIDEALKQSGITKADLDGIAVTYGPGLVGALLVGVSTAKAFAYGLSLPLIGVHHIEGHISANYIQHKELVPPFVCLVVSGGHTQLVHIKDYGCYEIIGQTRDDAAGEAFDKVARTLGLGYPGGPEIDRLARQGDPGSIDFPRVHMKDHPFDFSFSGLKTAVINYLHNKEQKGESFSKADVAASFQKAVTDILVEKAVDSARMLGQSHIVMAGGVAANSALKQSMEQEAGKYNIRVLYPSPVLCTDNAAMIACAGYYRLMKGNISDLSLNAVPYVQLTSKLQAPKEIIHTR
jgi:N6-L-threonylcarbamoyladenine synthase